jgi:flagellar basal body-associated protein FliL
MTADGKENVKREIVVRLQKLFGVAYHVTNVYFIEFVIQ